MNNKQRTKLRVQKQRAAKSQNFPRLANGTRKVLLDILRQRGNGFVHDSITLAVDLQVEVEAPLDGLQVGMFDFPNLGKIWPPKSDYLRDYGLLFKPRHDDLYDHFGFRAPPPPPVTKGVNIRTVYVSDPEVLRAVGTLQVGAFPGLISLDVVPNHQTEGEATYVVNVYLQTAERFSGQPLKLHGLEVFPREDLIREPDRCVKKAILKLLDHELDELIQDARTGRPFVDPHKKDWRDL